MDNIKISYKSICFILPPLEICNQIQELREQYEEDFNFKILPHITLFYPFVEPNEFNFIATAFKKKLSGEFLGQNFKNLEIKLEKLNYFKTQKGAIIHIQIENPIVKFIYEKIVLMMPQLNTKQFIPHLTLGTVPIEQAENTLIKIRNIFKPVSFNFSGFYFSSFSIDSQPYINNFISLTGEAPIFELRPVPSLESNFIPTKNKPENFDIYLLDIPREIWISKTTEEALNYPYKYKKDNPKELNPNYKLSHNLYYLYKNFIIDIFKDEYVKLNFDVNIEIDEKYLEKKLAKNIKLQDIKKNFIIDQFVENKLLEICKAENFFNLYREDNNFLSSFLQYFIKVYKENQYKISFPNVLCYPMQKINYIPAGMDLYNNPLNIEKKKLEFNEIFKVFGQEKTGSHSYFLSVNKELNIKFRKRHPYIINTLKDIEKIKDYPYIYNILKQITEFINIKYPNLSLYTWTIIKYASSNAEKKPHFDKLENIKSQLFIVNFEVSSFIDFYPVFDNQFKSPIRIKLKHGDILSFYQYSLSLWTHGIPRGYPFMDKRFALTLHYFYN